MKKILLNQIRRWLMSRPYIAHRLFRVTLPILKIETIQLRYSLKIGKVIYNLGSGKHLLETEVELPLMFPAYDTVLTNSLRKNGTWDAEGVRAVIKAMHPFKEYTLIDVGANVGLFSIQIHHALSSLGRIQQLQSIIAFEPVSTIFRCLEWNFKNANIGRSRLINMALGSSEETGSIYVDTGNSGNNSLLFESVENVEFDEESIIIETLSGAVSDLETELSNSIILKMDVQGFEPDAVVGIDDATWLKVEIAFLEITPQLIPVSNPSFVDKMVERLMCFSSYHILNDNDSDRTQRLGVEQVSSSQLKRMIMDKEQEYFNVIAVK